MVLGGRNFEWWLGSSTIINEISAFKIEAGERTPPLHYVKTQVEDVVFDLESGPSPDTKSASLDLSLQMC